MKNRRPEFKADNAGISEVCVGSEYGPDEVEFMLAVERFRREKNRRFPTCSDVLGVLKSLGYRKHPAGE